MRKIQLKHVISGVLATLIVLTIFIFFYGMPQLWGSSMARWGLFFIILAESISLCVLYFACQVKTESGGTFLKSGLTILAGCYIATAFAVSILLGTLLENHFNWYLILQLLVIAMVVLVAMIIFYFSKQSENTAHYQATKSNWEHPMVMLESLMKQFMGTDYEMSLKSLVEDLRYSVVGTAEVQDDSLIVASIDELYLIMKQTGTETVVIEQKLKDVQSLLQERKTMVQLMNRGGF